jgi:2-polyprenyl-6-hydroxyphenyl methylase/3-demethylubiquinone-9 3-methyltransferase
MNSREYYEKYWLQEAPPPDSDPTVGCRQRLLLKCFERFGPKTETASAILDAGCGSGEFLKFFVSQGFRTVGLDISLSALERARRRTPESPVAMASLDEALCFKSSSFDLVWFTEVLEHLMDTSQALTEIHRILKPEGLLVLTTPYHGFIKNLAITIVDFDKHFDVAGPHIRFFTKKSLSASLKRAGFDLLHFEGFGRGWPLYKSLFVVASKPTEG